MDTDFDAVIGTCAALPRRHGWITSGIEAAYGRLHHLGVAHSVEAWDGDRLVGGLYGVGLGGLFAGESMFHKALDASKVALVALVDHLNDIGATLLDVQWVTPHLASLGAINIPRDTYLQRLADALDVPGWGPECEPV